MAKALASAAVLKNRSSSGRERIYSPNIPMVDVVGIKNVNAITASKASKGFVRRSGVEAEAAAAAGGTQSQSRPSAQRHC